MKYVNLGASGVRVSRVCLGMMSYGNDSERPWVLDENAAEPIVKAAADGGITFYDTADTYSGGASEVATGRLLAKLFRRDDVVVATKVFMPMGPGENNGGLSRKHILSGIDASLRRLDMDYVDLYQIHRWDYRTPIEETMEALHDVVRAGKARYLGASTMYAWQLATMKEAARRGGWTRCTRWSRRARPVISARAACSPGSSPRPSTWLSCTAGPGSGPCRTTTTCSTARKSGR